MSQDTPEFGPGGYVPPRAAQRARKIVLREQMGLGWPIAALVAGLVVAVTGIGLFLTQSRPPGEPYRPVAPIDRVDAAGAGVLALPPLPDGVLVVRAGGGVRAFAAPRTDVRYCAPSQRLEGGDGTVYNLNGRAVGGPAESLRPLPGEVFDGVLYVEPRPLPAAPRSPDAERPTCRPS